MRNTAVFVLAAFTAAVWVRAHIKVEPPLVERLTECYGEHHGISGISIEYADYVQWVPCVLGNKGKGPNGECVAGGWARPYSRLVTYYEPFIKDDCELCASATTTFGLNWIAAHETCHLSGIHSEALTNACTTRALSEAGCRSLRGTDP